MKKRTILLGIATAILTFTHAKLDAQELTILAGPSFSTVKTNDFDDPEIISKRRAGFNAGALIGYEVIENFQIQTGIMFMSAGYKFTVPFDTNEEGVEALKRSYLHIPILAKYSYEVVSDLKVFGAFGPSFGFALGGEFEDYFVVDGKKIESDKFPVLFNGKDGDYKKFNAALLFQIGASYKNINAMVFVQPGLTNVFSEDIIASGFTEKTRTWGLSLGYTINFKK
jgi:hypothetical protein